MTSRQIRRAQERRAQKLARKSAAIEIREPAVVSTAAPQAIEPAVAQAPPTRAEINRANAQHSSGPVTREGKAKSCLNHFKHGFCGQFSVLPSESQDEFDSLFAALHRDHQPANLTEQILVERMAQHHWLGQRAIRLQTALLSNDQAFAENEKTFSLYLRYQTANERAFSKCLHDLLKLKSAQRTAVNDARKAERDAQRAETEAHKQEQKEAAEIRKQKAAAFNHDMDALEAEYRSDLEQVERFRKMPLEELLGRPVPSAYTRP